MVRATESVRESRFSRNFFVPSFCMFCALLWVNSIRDFQETSHVNLRFQFDGYFFLKALQCTTNWNLLNWNVLIFLNVWNLQIGNSNLLSNCKKKVTVDTPCTKDDKEGCPAYYKQPCTALCHIFTHMICNGFIHGFCEVKASLSMKFMKLRYHLVRFSFSSIIMISE